MYAAVGSVLVVVAARNALGQAVQMQPITVSGYNQDLIAETAPSSSSTTASFDTYNLQNFYATSYAGSSGGGLPNSGNFTSLFNSPTGGATVFQLAPYNQNNALEFNLAPQDTGAPYANSGTLSLASAQSYTNLAFLSCATNAQPNKTDLSINYTLNFAGGVTATGTIAAIDWSENTSPISDFAIDGLGQVNQSGTFGSNTLGMVEQDIAVPAADQNLLLTSVAFSSAGTDFCWAIYGVSGAVNTAATIGTLIWNGNVNSYLDTTNANFQGGVPFPTTSGYGILFDDSASGTTNVVVDSTTILPSAVTFNNNSKPYNISGANLTVGGALTIGGGGSVAFFNNQSYGSPSTMNGGSLLVASPGSLSMASFDVTGGSVTVQNSKLAATAGLMEFDGVNVSLTNSTTSATTTYNLGSGTILNMQGGSLTAQSVSLTSASMNVQSGTMSVSSAITLTTATLYLQSTALTTGSVNINSTSTMNVSGGSLTTPLVYVANQGYLSVLNGGVIGGTGGNPLSLTGSGNITLLTNGILSAGGSTNYSGSLVGTSGLNLSAGVISVGANSLLLTGPINVGTSASSTAYLLISDSSGTAGQGSSGSPLTITVAGTGPIGASGGYSGVIQGVPSSGSTFAANLIITPGTVISGGYGELPSPAGTLTLTGTISGTGPVYFSSNGNDTTILANSNTYTGETRIQGTTGSVSIFDTQTLQLASNNGISPSSGLNLIATTSNELVDLNGFNQTVVYLTGGNLNSTISSYAGNSVLTVNPAAATSASFSGIIAGNILLTKAGLGTQTLTGNNTYNLGTRINAGTLIPTNPNALGSGPVTLGGGTLSLPGLGGNLSGFGGFTFTGANYSPNVSNGVLHVTTPLINEATSSFINEVINNGVGFTASFLYTPTAGAAGMAFVIENDPRGATALGAGGASLGYGGSGAISNSAALEFNLTGAAFGFGTNGTISTTVATGGRGYSGPKVGDQFQVTVTYNGSSSILSEKITDTANTLSGTYNYSTNLTQLLGSNIGYIGFTGSTTSSTSSNQNISNFTFTNGNLSVPISIPNTVGTASATGTSVLTGPGGGLTSIGAMSVASGSILKIVGSPVGNAGKLVVQTPSLSIAGSTGHWTGTLDITNSAMDIQNADIAAVTNQLKQGYGNGTWQGSGGITSSTAAADPTHLTAAAAISNNVNGNPLYGSAASMGYFEGASPGTNDVLVKYTYYGDTNLDGKIDGTDYSRIDAAFSNNRTAGPGSQLTGWFNGDFNYDGAVDGSDYTLIDNAYNMQGAALSTELATPTADIAGASAGSSTESSAGSSAVPEPASLSFMGMAALALLGRARRRQL